MENFKNFYRKARRKAVDFPVELKLVDVSGALLCEGQARIVDLSPDGALLVALGDMPWVQPDTYASLLSALDSDTIIQPLFRQKPGNPVGFGRRFYPLLQTLQGEGGGRQILRDYPDQVRPVAVDDAGIHRDLDSPPSALPDSH